MRVWVFLPMLWLCFDLLGQQGNLSEYNVVWNSQSKNSSESMPLVGGDIGCNVWVEDNQLLIYLQRSGSLTEIGEYVKLGRLRFQLAPNPFSENSVFKQELKLEEGYVEITSILEGDSATIRIWLEVDRPNLHVDMTSSRPLSVTAHYENWRYEDHIKPEDATKARFGVFNIEGYPGEVRSSKDSIAYRENSVVFYHRNPSDGLVPRVVMEQQGLSAYKDQINNDIAHRTFGGILSGRNMTTGAQKDGDYQNTPYKSWTLVSERPLTKHHITLATHIDQEPNQEKWQAELLRRGAESEKEIERKFESSKNWWRSFWNRSWIKVNPGEGESSESWQVGRNYQLFRYQLGGNENGEYPTKFNGGNLIFDPVLVEEKRAFNPDWRAWGGSVFTAQNQRLLYWPMLKSGDFDAMLPQFELYRKGLPGATARVEEHFGHAGAVFSEYMSVPGMALGAGYGWDIDGYRRRGTDVAFGDPVADANLGYGDPVEKGVMANSVISYHWESQVEHAYMILQYHLFTGYDISEYMSFIKSALVFFDEHYQKRQLMRNGSTLGEDGKLVFFPSTSCESYRGATNPVDLISGIRACLQILSDERNQLVDTDEKEYYDEYLSRLPGYYFDVVKGDSVLLPAKSWMSYKNVECPQFYPLFPFDQFSLGQDDMTIFRNTWEHGTFPKGMVQSWHQDGIFFARMGMTNEAKDYNVKKLKNSQRRYPTFWGPGHDWVPDHNWGGSGMIGLQEMLMQTFGNQILLFPAWPEDWDVDFKLHAPGNTTVTGRLIDGVLEDLKVTPASRKEDVKIMAFENK